MKKQKGITLVALIITIIVLLILAGITIGLIVGDNAVPNKAKKASLYTKLAEIEEQANLIYLGKKVENNSREIKIDEVVGELKEKGYHIENIVSGNAIKNLTLEPESGSVLIGEAEEITVSYEQGEGKASYYAVVNGKYYEIIDGHGTQDIKVNRTESKLDSSSSASNELEVKIENEECAVVKEVTDNTVKIEGNMVGATGVTISCGGEKKTYNITVNGKYYWDKYELEEKATGKYEKYLSQAGQVTSGSSSNVASFCEITNYTFNENTGRISCTVTESWIIPSGAGWYGTAMGVGPHPETNVGRVVYVQKVAKTGTDRYAVTYDVYDSRACYTTVKKEGSQQRLSSGNRNAYTEGTSGNYYYEYVGGQTKKDGPITK